MPVSRKPLFPRHRTNIVVEPELCFLLEAATIETRMETADKQEPRCSHKSVIMICNYENFHKDRFMWYQQSSLFAPGNV
jgi:hypothetical protein